MQHYGDEHLGTWPPGSANPMHCEQHIHRSETTHIISYSYKARMSDTELTTQAQESTHMTNDG